MVNRVEIHALWSALVQAWKLIWLAPDDAARWAMFSANCDRLLSLVRQQGLESIDKALSPLSERLKSVDRLGEDDKAAVDLLLPGVFAAVREVCSDNWHRDGPSVAEGLPLVVMLARSANAWEELAPQLEQLGYALRGFTNYREGMQKAISKRAIAVLIEVGSDADASVMGLVDELNRYGPKWFAFSESSSFELRLEAVRHASQGFFVQPLQAPLLADALDPLAFKEKEEPYRVLVLDDSATVLASIRKALFPFSSIHVETLRQPPQILDVLRDFSPDVLLLDFHMDGCNGLEVAKIIRQNKAFESIPIVYLTAETSESIQLEAMRNGGDDFLSKPISQTQLVNAVISKAERYRGLRRLMVEDSLTGLYNHVKTKALLQQAMLLADRNKGSVSYAILDIDHFKRVNDTWGHAVGDKVIRALARFLRQQVRQTDVIGRYGGEEFVVVFYDTPAEGAYEKLDAMRQAFAEIQHLSEGNSFSVTFSAGIASYPPNTGMAELMASADEALYAAKRGGRNRVVRAA